MTKSTSRRNFLGTTATTAIALGAPALWTTRRTESVSQTIVVGWVKAKRQPIDSFGLRILAWRWATASLWPILLSL